MVQSVYLGGRLTALLLAVMPYSARRRFGSKRPHAARPPGAPTPARTHDRAFNLLVGRAGGRVLSCTTQAAPERAIGAPHTNQGVARPSGTEVPVLNSVRAVVPSPPHGWQTGRKCISVPRRLATFSLVRNEKGLAEYFSPVGFAFVQAN